MDFHVSLGECISTVEGSGDLSGHLEGPPGLAPKTL